MVSQDERVALISLTLAAIAMTVFTIYLVRNKTSKDDLILNNRIHLLQAGGDFEEGFQDIYQKQKNLLGNFDTDVLEPSLNSAELRPSDWNSLVNDISNKYNHYDAFVIVHGRDTLTYTAAAMSFLLENLNKPVIFVDGEVVSALIAASTCRIPEVMIYSAGKLLRGCKSTSHSTASFSSPNYPPMTLKTCLRPPVENYVPRMVNPDTKIRVIRMFPGMDAKYLNNTMAKELVNGIIFESYGVGHGPTDEQFLNVVSLLAKKGIIMVNVSQASMMEIAYEPNDRFIAAGILDGKDMTTEAAFAKLHYLMANVEDRKLIGQLMSQNLRGEMIL